MDLLNAYSSMLGLQFFSVARSLCEHSRIFLNCQCDEEFLNYYFSEYSEDEIRLMRIKFLSELGN